MKAFVEHPQFELHRSHAGGDQWVFRFSNGYGASVVRHSFSYGSKDGLFELAVLGRNDRLCYDTPITNDVLGHLKEEAVLGVLDKIAALPADGSSEAPPAPVSIERCLEALESLGKAMKG